MKRASVLMGALLVSACNIPPKDPFAAAEHALARNDLLRALQAYDAVPVKHVRYPDARAAAGDVEQRMRRCHELILEALMLRAEWRDKEALERLERAADHWPGQPSLQLWIAATEERLRLFGDRHAETAEHQPAAPVPLIEIQKPGQGGVVMSHGVPAPVAVGDDVASGDGSEREATRIVVGPVEVPSRGPLPMVPMESKPAREQGSGEVQPPVAIQQPSTAPEPSARSSQPEHSDPGPTGKPDVQPVAQTEPTTSGSGTVGGQPESPVAVAGESRSESAQPEEPARPSEVVKSPPSPVAAPAGPTPTRRLPMSQDPVALGMVSVEAALGRGELTVAVRDLIELARRFPDDKRVNVRLSRLLHQRALMHYGSGAVAAAIADWQRVLKIEPDNQRVRRLLQRARAESQSK